MLRVHFLEILHHICFIFPDPFYYFCMSAFSVDSSSSNTSFVLKYSVELNSCGIQLEIALNTASCCRYALCVRVTISCLLSSLDRPLLTHPACSSLFNNGVSVLLDNSNCLPMAFRV